jgi:uncharacterized protein involved in exopolysaccharide biosynthesis
MNPRLATREVSLSFTLRDLATPLFRCKRVLIATFLFVFATATLLGLLRFHKYESDMVILDGRQRLDPVVTAEAANQTGAPAALTDREVKSDAELIKTPDLLKQVVLANGMQKKHGGGFFHFFRSWQTEAYRVERAVQALGSQIQVEAPPNTNLIKVTYRSSDPALAYGVLKSLGNLYLEKRAADESHAIELAIAADEQRIQSDLEQLNSTQSLDETDSEAEAKRQSYSQDLSQREKEHTSDELARARGDSVALAAPPGLPVRPTHSRALILFIALAVAVLVSLLTTFIIDYFDPSFHTPAEVIDILGIGVVVALAKRTA